VAGCLICEATAVQRGCILHGLCVCESPRASCLLNLMGAVFSFFLLSRYLYSFLLHFWIHDAFGDGTACKELCFGVAVGGTRVSPSSILPLWLLHRRAAWSSGLHAARYCFVRYCIGFVCRRAALQPVFCLFPELFTHVRLSWRLHHSPAVWDSCPRQCSAPYRRTRKRSSKLILCVQL
jgi:hypothetical protein